MDLNIKQKNLQEYIINEEELKEFMIYYETDQIDDLNLNYYYDSKIKVKYSKDDKDELIKLLSNNIKEVEDFKYIEEFKT